MIPSIPPSAPVAQAIKDASGNTIGLTAGSAIIPALGISSISGGWVPVGSIFRLAMNGTGTLTLDSKDSLGNITLNVFSATLGAAVNQIGFPYAGAAATSIRATLTGTATASVI